MQLFQAKPFLILSFAFCVLRQVQGQLTAKGCYQDKEHDRALPELLHSYRGGMNWRDLRGTVIENCKKEAVKKGYECFGIQFYGECWSGEDACDVDNYAVHGESDDCWCSGNNYKQYNPKRPCIGAVGGEYTNFVYKID
ncbi:uncharacterized protein LOC144665558 [Oculina patagonica]